jgi:hypothetical protein
MSLEWIWDVVAEEAVEEETDKAAAAEAVQWKKRQ